MEWEVRLRLECRVRELQLLVPPPVAGRAEWETGLRPEQQDCVLQLLMSALSPAAPNGKPGFGQSAWSEL
ncbi:hypothetical protein [Paenibacillus tepidiphilus]|uniref:hypothetical protein n=1 Tax=Paenibacillus tepidiphilus TaxID=2608683 RepID=UPI00123C0A85|nr:hypothetical protein [Paenibacillus tepidiphilus]